MVATLAVTLGSSLPPAEAQEGRYSIQGTVLDPSGEPVEGVIVVASGMYGEPSFGPWESSPSDADGAYTLEVPDGSYVMRLYFLLDGVQCTLGYVGSDLERSYLYPNNRIAMSGGDLTDLETRLPGTLSELCRPIQGIVTDASGQPIEGLWVAADGLGPVLRLRATGPTAADGTFRAYGPPGRYNLLLPATTAGTGCTAVDLPDSKPGREATIEVGSEGISGIRLLVAGGPSDTFRGTRCFFPPEMITTELQPGWNLAGWTGDEADVDALFRAIPGLEVAHAWDAEGGYFLSVFHGAPDEVNSLKVLTPGMGLWLYLSRNEPVEWTRPLLPGSGFVSLRGGWNLVSWSGEEGIRADGALAPLDSDLRTAGAWDAHTGQALHYAPAGPAADNTLQGLARGGALWVEVSENRPWLQTGVSVPVEFGEDYSEDRQEELRALIDTALTFYAHRFGVFVPGITVRYRDDYERNCFYSNKSIFLKERCWTAIGHEYGHAVQEHLAGGDSSPRWIIEGTANRWSAQFHDARGFRTYASHLRDTVHPQARRTLTPLEDLEASLSEGGLTQNYNLIHVAIDYLVELVGEDRTFEYFRQRANYRTWQDAFHGTFGLSVDDFYTEFAEYRVSDFAPFEAIRGRAVTPEGSPVGGLWLGAFPLGEAGYLGVSTSADGTFTLRLPDGAYHLRFHTADATQCTVRGYEGAVAGRQAIIRLDADGVSGVQIVASGPPSDQAVWSPCTFAE